MNRGVEARFAASNGRSAMATDCIPQLTFDFPGLRKPVVARFDAELASSDGGLPLLKALDERLGLTAELAEAFRDRRDPAKVEHTLHDLLRQRIYGLACGYEDANDAARLAHDPVHKLALDRDPLNGRALAAQPTISRFENAVDRKSLYRMAEALADLVIDTERRRRGRRHPRLITIDLDPTDDPTHGQQELAFFTYHYDSWCYLPLIATIRFDAEPEQHLVAAVLRPGNVQASLGAVGILKRLVPALRRAFPWTRLRVRLDGGFTDPDLFALFDNEGLEYVVGMPQNTKLNWLTKDLVAEARARSATSGQSERVWGDVSYRTRSWNRDRRVIIKAEVTRLPGREPRDNPRYVVTNLCGKPERVYAIYCGRGDEENRIKELKNDLALGRTSCTRFVANQLRVLLVAAAYVLMQQLRRHADGTGCERAQVGTLRLRLLKVAAWVERSVRRIVLHLPVSFPWRSAWHTIAWQLGAAVT
jgi:hypothetical protein